MMADVIEFYVPVRVQPKQSMRWVKGHPRANPKVRINHEIISGVAIGHRPTKPWEGPLELSLTFQYAWLKLHKKAVRERDTLWKITSPDLDNLCKQVLDVLQGMGFFLDDAQVVVVHACKEFSRQTGVHVKLEKLTQETQ